MSFADETFEVFKLYFPDLAEEVLEYYPIGDWRLAVILPGKHAIFNALTQHTRFFFGDPDLDENEWRRRFGACLSDILSEKRMTQKDLSECTGVSYIGISRYINGQITPSAYTLRRIANGLGCSIDDLLSYEIRMD